ncbi:hypothetical protein KEM48_009184 [Puccinia striiformis f. sp. tritici PST-130]|nr:hypothetical protein KEM48_009184 [Puccinia striiformis f. sp. tritici PST-130]
MYCRISLAVFLILQAVANAAPSSSGEVGAKKSMRCHVTKTMDRLVGDDVPWPKSPGITNTSSSLSPTSRRVFLCFVLIPHKLYTPCLLSVDPSR